jgi:ABC-type sulfate/molybdate transport systems ATPase subunit
MIELVEISKEFGKRVILNGISLQFSRSRIVICGTIGSGKTTLLRILAGLTPPTRGKVLLDGMVISSPHYSLHPSLRGISMVFQNPSLWPHMTVQKSLHFVLSAKKIPRNVRSEKVNKILESFGLGSLRDEYPGRLSGGERKKVSLAIALAVEPRFLLLDEPFENIDDQHQKEIMSLLLEVFDSKKIEGLLCVTHNPTVAKTLGEQIYSLEKGRLKHEER